MFKEIKRFYSIASIMQNTKDLTNPELKVTRRNICDLANGQLSFINSYFIPRIAEYPFNKIIIDELDNCDQTKIKINIPCNYKRKELK